MGYTWLTRKSRGRRIMRKILSYWRIRNLILSLLYQRKSKFVSGIAFKLWLYVDEVGV